MIVQLAYCTVLNDTFEAFRKLEINLSGSLATLYTVELMPSRLPVFPRHDGHYLRTEPGLYPDLLLPYKGFVRSYENQYRAVWIEVDTRQLVPGEHSAYIEVKDISQDRKVVFKKELTFSVINQELPKTQFIHTEWFYVDCLANYYGLEPYSEGLWRVIENFIDFASKKSGINTILTPIFTPPLDTEVGKERKNVQLVGIEKTTSGYHFDFQKVRKWCRICRAAGIGYLEMPHLFTQWGAEFTPNIYLNDGMKIFGWDVPSSSPEYRRFLSQLLPELLEVLEDEGYSKERLIFHISDEPGIEHLKGYKIARSQVIDLLVGCKVMDALSDYQLFEQGVVPHPVVSTDHIQKFIAHNVPELWTYYCCAQSEMVPNRFFSEPSYRNRVLGTLMYVHQVTGFLHWGFNFYNKQFSAGSIDPFCITDADGCFPSGDPFIVYPGENGKPLTSIRNEVQMQGFEDLGALQLLEKLTSREKVLAFIIERVGYLPTFENYPQNPEWLIKLRNEINQMIVDNLYTEQLLRDNRI